MPVSEPVTAISGEMPGLLRAVAESAIELRPGETINQRRRAGHGGQAHSPVPSAAPRPNLERGNSSCRKVIPTPASASTPDTAAAANYDGGIVSNELTTTGSNPRSSPVLTPGRDAE
ncbi:hypothetical protein MATL_G00212630 [Megalops atlanticus]|uniref:Uncharacterized protein n=1 Tax=Megalops atlanticus TaxID=7932 RepID=A0A9D3T3R6_MEGAT|nr:hypothetical protein MATL_G00212630 [Megalops atlanticus]